MDARVHVYTATALGRGRVASPTLGRLYPGGSPGTHFIGGLVDLKTNLDMKERNFQPSETTAVVEGVTSLPLTYRGGPDSIPNRDGFPG